MLLKGASCPTIADVQTRTWFAGLGPLWEIGSLSTRWLWGLRANDHNVNGHQDLPGGGQ